MTTNLPSLPPLALPSSRSRSRVWYCYDDERKNYFETCDLPLFLSTIAHFRTSLEVFNVNFELSIIGPDRRVEEYTHATSSLQFPTTLPRDEWRHLFKAAGVDSRDVIHHHSFRSTR